ncbi:hypothetical protein RRG08_028542 [Elysia crispata]|uniref:Fibrinogen C-terminal domain-containing protein n=1 Tax=Elysia crispata TaxID=231223 RepID=A0AAE1CUY8_9GAST|nr:hypothetical protein RRG08_028542 [Elysia crispata]
MKFFMMKIIFAVITYLYAITPEVQCLELSLDFKTPTSPGHRKVCGVLICEENFKPSTMMPGSMSQNRTISGLSVFRNLQDSIAGTDKINSGRKTLIASLRLSEPKITRVSNGVIVDGFLESWRAMLRLEMFKEADCSAHYSCEVRLSDDLGNELIQTNTLRQHMKQHEDQAPEVSITPGVLVQQVTLLQQQINMFGASVEKQLQDNYRLLDGKFGTLRDKLDVVKDQFVALENRFGHTESRLNTVQGRVEDKILYMHDQIENKIETRIVDKLCQLETQLPNACSDVGTVLQRLDKFEESFTTLKNHIKDENQKAHRLNTLAISSSTGKIVSALQTHMTEILTWAQSNQFSLNKLETAKDKIFNSSEELSNRFQTDLLFLISNFEQLKAGMLNSSTNTLSAVQDLITETNATLWNSLTPIVVDTLSPKVCKKGMFPSLLGTAFPYHLIQPTGKAQLQVPYLCDSVTEGGGWIVIQRRFSGGTDFTRNWEDYREGFGSLYDDFWWGNKNIHTLTSSGKYELRIDLKYKGKASFAHYDSISLDSENNNYMLKLGAYDGTAGDSLGFHSGKQFSTHDRDNDGRSQNDAAVYLGGWWYYRGYHSNLNGKWGTNGNYQAMTWNLLTGSNSVTFSEMKIRKL